MLEWFGTLSTTVSEMHENLILAVAGDDSRAYGLSWQQLEYV